MNSEVKCPGCGKPMLPGRLESNRSIFWAPRRPEGHWKKYMNRAGLKYLWEDLKSGLEVYEDGEYHSPWLGIPTDHCPDCQLFLFRGRVR